MIAFDIGNSIQAYHPLMFYLSESEIRSFETRTFDELMWSELEGFFKGHGYNFRPRFRREWTPSWHTTGISPVKSEDGEMLKVHLLLRFHPCSLLNRTAS